LLLTHPLSLYYNVSMGLFSKNSAGKERYVIILDIGSGSVGGAVVALASDSTPEIRFSARKAISFQEHLSFPRFLTSMRKALAEICGELARAVPAQSPVERIFVTLASPWYASQTRIVHYARPEEFMLTEKGIAKLIEREIELFRSSTLFAKSKQEQVPPEIMEAKNIRVSLNGYEVKSPFGKRATELDLALYISLVSGPIHKAITEEIAIAWPHAPLHFSSFAFSAFDSIRDIFSDEACFLFVDISGESTDMSIIINNILLESVSFPLGTNSLLRSFMQSSKTTAAAAASELETYLAGDIHDARADEIEHIVTLSLEEWSGSFGNALAQFAKEFPIPRVIFYTVDDAYGEVFENAMKQVRFSRFGGEDYVFALRRLGMKFLAKFVHAAGPEGQDSFLAVEAIFANKFSALTAHRRN